MASLGTLLLSNHQRKSDMCFCCVCVCGTLDATLEGSSMGYLSLPDSQKPVAFPGVIAVSDIKVSRESHAAVTRRKRNILFQSGVKHCVQETPEQLVAHHLSYFHLRGEAEHKRADRGTFMFNIYVG